MRAYPFHPYRLSLTSVARSVVRQVLLFWLLATVGFLCLVESGSRASDIRGLGDLVFSFALSALLTAVPTFALWLFYRFVRFAFR
jgi:Ca2+/Na+ antiporter